MKTSNQLLREYKKLLWSIKIHLINRSSFSYWTWNLRVESTNTMTIFVLVYCVERVSTCVLAATKQLYAWFSPSVRLSVTPFYPSALRAGGVLSSRSGRAVGRAGGCQTCGTHISVTAWRIFSVRSSMELSRPVVVHCHAHLPICPIWARPWAENLSNLPQIGSRLCGSHISETAGWIYPI